MNNENLWSSMVLAFSASVLLVLLGATALAAIYGLGLGLMALGALFFFVALFLADTYRVQVTPKTKDHGSVPQRGERQ